MSQSDESPGGLDPDEPHTPVWFTALGVGLLFMGSIYVLASADEEGPAEIAPTAEVPGGEQAPAEGPAAENQVQE